MQSLRPYQQRIVEAVFNHWRTKRAPVIVAPTGSGKTTILAHILRRFPSKQVLFLCPWRKLVYQGYDRLDEHDLPAGILMGERHPDTGQTVHVASIQTAIRRDLGQYDLIVVDEAHRALARQCFDLLNKYPRAKLLGMTATPIRLDGKPLANAFDGLIDLVSVKDLIGQGYLVPHKIYGPPHPIDTSAVTIDYKTRDFRPDSLAHVMRSRILYGDAAEAYKTKGEHRPAFLYACNLAHANDILKHFTENARIESAIISGETPTTERERLFQAIRDRSLRVLINVGVLTEGVDVPEVSCVIVCRPTLSMGLWLQMLGRGSRPATGKTNCVVLDHADNTRRHGFPDEDRPWSLQGRPNQASKGQRLGFKPKAKKCPECGLMVPVQTTTCPQCGYLWLPHTKPGALVVLDPRTIRTESDKPLWY